MNLTRKIDQINNESEFLQFKVLEEIVKKEDVSSLDYYLSKGLDINARDRRLNTIAFFLDETSVEFIEVLVEKGLFIHAQNITGENLLMRLAMNGSKEQLKYFLTKGLDPYKSNVKGMNVFKLVGNLPYFYVQTGGVPIEFVLEHSRIKEDTFYSVEKAIFEKNYPLAMAILEEELQNMGGFKKLFSYGITDETFDILKRVYTVFILNKKFHLAKEIIRLFIDVSKSPNQNIKDLIREEYEIYPTEEQVMDYWVCLSNYVEPIGLELQLLNNEVEMTKELVDLYNRISCGYPVDHVFVQQYLLLKAIGVPNLEELMNHEMKEYGTEHQFGEVFIEQNIKNRTFLLDNLNEQAKNPNINLRFRNMYMLGLTYLALNDLVNAEYFLTKLVQEIEEAELLKVEYANAVCVLKYIAQKKRAE